MLPRTCCLNRFQIFFLFAYAGTMNGSVQPADRAETAITMPTTISARVVALATHLDEQMKKTVVDYGATASTGVSNADRARALYAETMNVVRKCEQNRQKLKILKTVGGISAAGTVASYRNVPEGSPFQLSGTVFFACWAIASGVHHARITQELQEIPECFHTVLTRAEQDHLAVYCNRLCDVVD